MNKIVRWLWSKLVVRGREARFYYRVSKGLRVTLGASPSPAFRRLLDGHLARTDKSTWFGKVEAGTYMRLKANAALDGFKVFVNGKAIKGVSK